MVKSVKQLNSQERIFLNMEDVIEHRIEIDKEACAELDKDWEDLYDGECKSCGRAYEAAYLVGADSRTDPSGGSAVSGSCIPCWRKENDLPKIDREISSEGVE